jgi:nicotinamidase-related amidase
MNTALVSIEFQNDYYTNGRTPVDKALEATTKAHAMINACRDKKLPIIHVQHISTQPDSASLLPCTKGAEFYHTVQPIKGETVIKKHYPNAFKDTQLLNFLIKNQINHLLICGMTTHMAIDATVRAAHDLGFSCTVLQDACAARQLEYNHTTISALQVHYAFLAALQPNYANVLSTEDYLQKIGVRLHTVASVA